MSTEEVAGRPPPLSDIAQAAPSSPKSSLRSLLSPVEANKSTSTPANPEDAAEKREDARDSVIAAEEDDVVDDDLRFSNVPLSAGARESTATLASVSASSRDSTIPIGAKRDRRNTVHIGSARSSTLVDASTSHHKRSLSGSSLTSTDALPFMLQRLELQKIQGEKSNHRQSQQIIKEEFNRVHEKEVEAESAVGGTIDWNFWGSVISDYQGYASENSERLAKAIEQGIPDALRGMMWQLMAASKEPELEAVYLKLLKETSPHEKAITRDLARTFPHHSFFANSQGIGQENLFNVLKAYSLYDDQVGYCQGLPFLVAILLLNMPDEEAFCLLVRLMYSYDLRGHYLPEMPKLQLRLFQFDRLVEEMLPVLHVHFLRQGIKSSMYTSQWYLTLFSYRFPHNIVFRIYDNILASGVEAIFAFSLALLQKNEAKLLTLKFDEVLAFLNNKVFEVYEVPSGDAESKNSEEEDLAGATSPSTAKDTMRDKNYRLNEFIADSAALRITPFILDSYAREYDDMVRVRDAHATEVDELRNTNRNLMSQVKSLEASLATLNAEHVELLNELVRSRLKNEETEGELVKYKLLYAEAMHESEVHQNESDSGSGAPARISNAFSFFSKRGSG